MPSLPLPLPLIAPALARTDADPLCVSVAASTGSVVPARPQPEGTRRMAERLARIREQADPHELFYLNDRMIPLLQTRIARAQDPAENARLRLDLARQFVLAGQPESALQELDALRSSLPDSPDLRLLRAIACLRLGEQENCLDRHSPDACILPLQGDGLHRLPRGSRGAIEALSAQLALAPGDLRARWLLNLAHMTLGQWPDQVPEPFRIPASVFAPEADIGVFPDIAHALGLDVDDLAGGCILDDFDNDGLIDVVASSWKLDGVLRVFRNQGDGSFRERTDEAGLAGIVGGLNIQQTDFDNDGWLDLWVLRGAWFGKPGRMPNSLLRNNRDGTFTDVTEASGLLSEHPTQTSAWFDYDGDGWLDVFIGNETRDPADPDRCELFHNNGDGTFTECARDAGLDLAAIVKGVAAGDFDNDGRPDLYLSCLDGPNRLFRNEGPASPNPVSVTAARPAPAWRFRDVSAAAGVDETIHSFPTWFFDFDNDGREDLFVSGYHIRDVGEIAADYLGLRHAAAKPRLYRNLGGGRFANITAQAGLDRVCQAMGSNFGDLDNDGWLDIHLGTGDPDLATLVPNRTFRNDRGRRFQEITTSARLGNLQKGHAVAFADLDNDGDQDLYHVLGGAYAGDRYRNALHLNPGHGRHWLKLRLVGTRANRPAIGARIAVTVQTPSGPRTLHRTLNSGGSFGSSTLRVELGLADATAVRQVDILWPGSGTRQRLQGLVPDHAYTVREGDPVPVPLHLPVLHFPTPATAARHDPAPTLRQP